jgi:hypothetical protein
MSRGVRSFVACEDRTPSNFPVLLVGSKRYAKQEPEMMLDLDCKHLELLKNFFIPAGGSWPFWIYWKKYDKLAKSHKK